MLTQCPLLLAGVLLGVLGFLLPDPALIHSAAR